MLKSPAKANKLYVILGHIVLLTPILCPIRHNPVWSCGCGGVNNINTSNEYGFSANMLMSGTEVCMYCTYIMHPWFKLTACCFNWQEVQVVFCIMENTQNQVYNKQYSGVRRRREGNG